MNSIKHLKRSVLFFLSLIMFISCSNEIYFKYSENSFDRLFVQEQIGISMSRTFLWDDGGAGSISFSENGDTMRITGLQSWLNGVGFERNDSSKYYDLTDVAYMTFKVHGTMPLERAKVSVSSTGGSYGDDFNLKYWSVDPENYSETTDSTILIDLSSMDAESMKMVERIFLFIANNDDKTEGIPLYESGQWMEISGIDFLNADKQHVDIRYGEIEYNSGSLGDAFNRLDIGAVDLQSWEGTSRIEVRNTGLRIYSLGGTWFGGAVAAPSGEYVDFSDVSAITFEVRGNMKPEEVAIGFNTIGYNGTFSLNEIEPDAYFDENTFASYTIEVPESITEIQRMYVSQVLCFNQGSSYSGPGKWIEIRDISYLDEKGNILRLENTRFDDVSAGSWNDLFSNLDAEKTRIDLQVWTDWNGNADLTLTNEGLRVIPTGDWAGGGIVNYEANLGETYYKAFDFSNIVRMEYEIKGDIDPRYLRIYVMRNSYMGSDGNNVGEASTPSGTLYDIGVSEIKENEWTKVSFDIPDEMSEVNDPFTFVTVNGDGDDTSGWAGRYFIIRNITYYDAYGNSVELKYVK